MKRSILFACAAAALSAACAPRPSTAPAGVAPAPAVREAAEASLVRSHIAGLEADWARAISARDTAALRSLLREDFALHPPDSTAPLRRAAWIEVVTSRLQIDSAAVSDPTVEVAGDTARVEMTFYWRGRVGGRPVIDETMRVRDVWVRQGGVWRALRRHTSPSQPSRPR